MSPTATPSQQAFLRQPVRARRPRNANPYDVAHHTSPATRPGPPARHAVEPTLDEGDGEEGDTQEVDDGDTTLEGEDNTDVVDVTEDIDDGTADGEGAIEEIPMDVDPPFDPTGLKEIGNLASWTVSTCKPGCSVEALRDEDTNLFWQSDGPQPHHLNIHFSRLVCILSIRIYLDFVADESYTPTRITLLAGTGYHDLIPFSSLEFSHPKGWIDVPLEGVGGGADGNVLRCFLVQVKVVENHQNGKDTHIRGLKIYARDERAGGGFGVLGMEDMVPGRQGAQWKADGGKEKEVYERVSSLVEPDWMGEAELR